MTETYLEILKTTPAMRDQAVTWAVMTQMDARAPKEAKAEAEEILAAEKGGLFE